MDTDALIDRLASGAAPVRRLRPAWVRAAAWLALGLPPLLIIASIDGIVADPRSFVEGGRTSIEIAAILATAAAAAVCAFASTIPGAGRRWFLFPAVPLAFWLATIGKACVEDWRRAGIDGLLLRVDGPCFLPMVLMSTVPIIAMLIMLRRGAPLYPRPTLALGALAIAALTNFGLRLIHEPDISIQALAWSFAVVALYSAIVARRGRPAIDWHRHENTG